LFETLEGGAMTNHRNALVTRDRRDILNFLTVRDAEPRDDLAVGALLLKSFIETYSNKLPHITTGADRKAELLDVATRRREGVVKVVELGYRIVGTYTLIRPSSSLCQSWIPRTANLRCVAVDPEFHGYSFSEVILREAAEMAKRWECAGICLHVQKGADGVARLYTRFGFVADTSGDRVFHGHENAGYFYRFDSQFTLSSVA